MSKIKLTGSNSGYVEIDSAADAGNLTLTLPTSGVRLLSNTDNVFSGITTTGELDINGKIDVSTDAVIARNLSVGGITTHTGTTTLSDDVTFTGGSYNVVWDKSDNQLEFGDNAKISFGGQADMRLFHDGTNSVITNATGDLYINNNADTIIKPANDLFLKPQDGENGISVIGNGAVELYFNNSKKVETTNTGAVVTGICTATSFSGSGEGLTYTSPLSNRNLIINGAMNIAQRSASVSGVTSNDYHTCDRWRTQLNGPTISVIQDSDNPGRGFEKSLRFTIQTPVGSIAAGNVVQQVYKVEGYDIARLGYGDSNAKSFTLSFWVKSSLTGVFAISFVRDSRIVNRQVTISSAGTWEYKTVTIAGDTSTGFTNTTNNTGMSINITPSAGSNSTGGSSIATWGSFHTAHTAYGANMAHLTTTDSYFTLTGVQMEIGDTATPFEHRHYGDEFTRCQRYYCTRRIWGRRGGGVFSQNNNRAQGHWTFPVYMRTASITFTATQQYVDGTWHGSSISANNGWSGAILENGIDIEASIDITSGGGNGGTFRYLLEADAEL